MTTKLDLFSADLWLYMRLHHLVDRTTSFKLDEKIYEILRHFESQLEQPELLRSENTPAAPWLPILLIHIGTQVKTWHCQSYKFKEFAKNWSFKIFKQALYATHRLKLLDKMCKYGMDPASIDEDTERTRFCPRTDRRTRWNQYTPPSTSLRRGGG